MLIRRILFMSLYRAQLQRELLSVRLQRDRLRVRLRLNRRSLLLQRDQLRVRLRLNRLRVRLRLNQHTQRRGLHPVLLGNLRSLPRLSAVRGTIERCAQIVLKHNTTFVYRSAVCGSCVADGFQCYWNMEVQNLSFELSSKHTAHTHAPGARTHTHTRKYLFKLVHQRHITN
jgi:hypothetical protein